jgi:multiple sugar transport system substrate-binding protein
MVNWSGFAAMSAPADSPTHVLVRCAPVPRFDGPGGRRVALNSCWVLALAAGTSRPGEAYRLLRALTAPEMDRITAESGGVATRRDSWADPAVAASAPYYPQFEQAHNGTRALPRDPRWQQISLVINQMVGQIVTGQGAPDKLLAAAHEDLAALD